MLWLAGRLSMSGAVRLVWGDALMRYALSDDHPLRPERVRLAVISEQLILRSDELPDCGHHIGRLLGLWIVAGPLDDP